MYPRCTRFHISSHVRSLVTGIAAGPPGLPAAVAGSASCFDAVPIITISCIPRNGMIDVSIPTTAFAPAPAASAQIRCSARCRV